VIVTVCSACSPRNVEDKTKYYGHGECQACGLTGELRGHSLSEILKALALSTTKEQTLARTIRATGEGIVKGLALLRSSSEDDREMIEALTRVAESMTECPS